MPSSARCKRPRRCRATSMAACLRTWSSDSARRTERAQALHQKAPPVHACGAFSILRCMQSATRLRLRLRHRPLVPSIPVFAAFAAPVHHRKGENPCPIRHIPLQSCTLEALAPPGHAADLIPGPARGPAFGCACAFPDAYPSSLRRLPIAHSASAGMCPKHSIESHSWAIPFLSLIHI